MNFKTTILLIVLLAVAGIAVYFVQREPVVDKSEQKETVEKKLLADLNQDDIAKISIVAADGATVAFEKQGSDWKITQPVQGKADGFEVGDLVREIADMKTRAQVGSDVKTGVEAPRYRISIDTRSGKTRKLAIGEKSEVGDFMYVRVDEGEKTDVVPAGIERFLTKPANEYRNMKLVDASSTAVSAVTLRRGKEVLALQKDGADWKITQPVQWPGDSTEVSDLVSTITGMRTAEFVDQPLAGNAYQFSEPRLTVSYAEAPAVPATTQPTTAASQPAFKTIVFGRYDDIRKQNVFAQVDGAVVKIAATTLEQLNKKPMDLRDRRVLDLSAEKVERIAIRRDLAATTKPTSRPASIVELVIARHHEAPAPLGPAVPVTTQSATTRSATVPATTQASTAPAAPVAKWEFASSATTQGKVDETKADDLLSGVHPLRANKFIDALPTTRPADHYVLTITMADKSQHVVGVFASPGGDSTVVAEYNGAVFEVPQAFVDHLKADFAQAASQ